MKIVSLLRYILLFVYFVVHTNNRNELIYILSMALLILKIIIHRPLLISNDRETVFYQNLRAAP